MEIEYTTEPGLRRKKAAQKCTGPKGLSDDKSVKIELGLSHPDIEKAYNRKIGFKLNPCAGDFIFD